MLTMKDKQGNWCLKGIRWNDLRAGCTLSDEAASAIYEALCKLKDYEDTCLEPDEADRLKDELDVWKDRCLALRHPQTEEQA